jgi:hypothetical protein
MVNLRHYFAFCLHLKQSPSTEIRRLCHERPVLRPISAMFEAAFPTAPGGKYPIFVPLDRILPDLQSWSPLHSFQVVHCEPFTVESFAMLPLSADFPFDVASRVSTHVTVTGIMEERPILHFLASRRELWFQEFVSAFGNIDDRLVQCRTTPEVVFNVRRCRPSSKEFVFKFAAAAPKVALFLLLCFITGDLHHLNDPLFILSSHQPGIIERDEVHRVLIVGHFPSDADFVHDLLANIERFLNSAFLCK